MLPRLSRPLAIGAIAALAAVGATGCSDDGDTDDARDSSTTSAPPPEAPPTSGGSAQPGATPSWAKPFEAVGQLITTITSADFKVDVYQVGVAKATKNGTFVDPDTNKPIIATGDDIVFVNYVITNTGGATIQLPFNLVEVTPRYADWKYVQGMDGIADRDLYAKMKVADGALAPGNTKAPFAWEPGTSFSYGTNFKYQAGSSIKFTARLTPADAGGRLLHDQRKEASQETKIS